MLKSPRFVRFAFAAVLTETLLAGCSDQPGSEGWCQSMKDKPKGEWTGDDTKTYAAHCLLDSTTVGSDSWCAKLDERPKNKWTTEEVAQYAQYCVVKKVEAED